MGQSCTARSGCSNHWDALMCCCRPCCLSVAAHQLMGPVLHSSVGAQQPPGCPYVLLPPLLPFCRCTSATPEATSLQPCRQHACHPAEPPATCCRSLLRRMTCRWMSHGEQRRSCMIFWRAQPRHQTPDRPVSICSMCCWTVRCAPRPASMPQPVSAGLQMLVRDSPA